MADDSGIRSSDSSEDESEFFTSIANIRAQVEGSDQNAKSVSFLKTMIRVKIHEVGDLVESMVSGKVQKKRQLLAADSSGYVLIDLLNQSWMDTILTAPALLVKGFYGYKERSGIFLRLFDTAVISRVPANSFRALYKDAIPTLAVLNNQKAESELHKISEIIDGTVADNVSFTLKGKVLKIEETKTISRDRGPSILVRNIILKDHSGECKVALFGSLSTVELDVGDYVMITELRAKTYQGLITPATSFGSQVKKIQWHGSEIGDTVNNQKLLQREILRFKIFSFVSNKSTVFAACTNNECKFKKLDPKTLQCEKMNCGKKFSDKETADYPAHGCKLQFLGCQLDTATKNTGNILMFTESARKLFPDWPKSHTVDYDIQKIGDKFKPCIVHAKKNVSGDDVILAVSSVETKKRKIE